MLTNSPRKYYITRSCDFGVSLKASWPKTDERTEGQSQIAVFDKSTEVIKGKTHFIFLVI